MKIPFLVSRLALAVFCLVASLAPLSAQENKDIALPIGDATPQWSRLEGTVESTSAGVTSRAKISVQGPGQMRLDIQPDEAARIPAQTVLVTNGQTRTYDQATKRTLALPYSVMGLRNWNIQAGGPANFVLQHFADGLKLPATGKAEFAGADPNFISDYVRFGGSGDRIFYAPYKRTQWDGPAKVVLEWKGSGPVSTRTELDENGRVLTRAALSYTATGIPTEATVTDGANRVIAKFKYDLKEVAEPFPATTFAPPAIPGQIEEDAQLKSIDAYSGSDARNKFNQGMALMSQAEELPAAYTAWDNAAALAPQATAPHFAIYQAAIATRDLARAELALDQLERLLGKNSFTVLWQRTGLLLARRDWAGAQTTLEAAITAEPQNLQAKLSLADVLRARGDLAKAQSQLLEILKSTSPQSETQAQAAQMLAELSSGNATAPALAALPETGTATLWQNVARVLVQLQGGQTAKAFDTDNTQALAVQALQFERTGQDNEALPLWRKILTILPSPTDTETRTRLMALFARRGDFNNSLEQYRELIATAPGLKARRTVQEQLITAWQKVLRLEQLKTVLEQRSLSSNATADDVRLWLTYQEAFGDDEGIAAAIQNGMARFTRDAWWRARQSELLMERASQTVETRSFEQLQRDALRVIDDAVILDPQQPYYGIQRALILTQMATPLKGVVVRGNYDGPKKTAHAALDELLKKWPNDPDVQIAVASQRLALDGDGKNGPAIELLQKALRGGTAGVGEDRHFISFSSRQILISALRRDKRWEEITPQYEILFRVAQTGQEQVGVALNYLRLLMNQEQPEAIANLLIYMAKEAWSFDESQQVLVPLINVTAVNANALPPTIEALAKNPDPYARLVLAKLNSILAANARDVLADPDAPLDAERNLQAIDEKLKESLAALEPMLGSNDKIFAARAAALLGEEAINRNEPAIAVSRLRTATAIEPRDVNLRIAIANALVGQNQTSTALKERDEMLRVLPHDFATLQAIAKFSVRVGEASDHAFTTRLAALSANTAVSSPRIGLGQWQLAAFNLARANFDAGKIDEAIRMYNQLAGPQWNIIERAVALIDLEENLKTANQTEQAAAVAARLEALGLEQQQRLRAEDFWASLDD